ncbi:MAG: hypothetical protein ACP5QK_07495 [Myxococcota bacterium]
MFTLFTLLVSYNIFYREGGERLQDLHLHRIRSQIETIYTTLKYDLQNVIRNNEYKPISDIFIYEKDNRTLKFLKGEGISKEGVSTYIEKNIQNIVFLNDNFGYILPLVEDNKLFSFVAFESGENIYISTLSLNNEYKNIGICVESLDKSDGKGRCGARDYREVAKFKFFSIKFRYDHPLSLKFIILALILLIIIGAFFSFWVTRHLDLEENRIIGEIKNSIEEIKAGKVHLITLKSVYPLYNQLMESINSLIQTMSAEIDKHKVVYKEYFRREEEEKSITDSSESILKVFVEDLDKDKCLNLLKSFDLLLQRNGGGLKFKGKIDENQESLIRVMAVVMMWILQRRKGYQIILEFDESGISILSENLDFELGVDGSVLSLIDKVQISNRKITIQPLV